MSSSKVKVTGDKKRKTAESSPLTMHGKAKHAKSWGAVVVSVGIMRSHSKHDVTPLAGAS